MVIGLPERLASTVAPANAASALGGIGTNMSSQISTCSTKSGQVGCREQQVGTERGCDVADADDAALAVPGRELTALVELPVGGQVRLGRDTQHGAAMNDDRGVVDAVPVAQRRADHQHRQQIGGCDHDVEQGVLDRVEQRILQQDVLDRVARQRQLGEDRQRHAVVVALARQPQDRRGVGRRVADRGVVRARGDPDKTLAVAVVEIHCLLLSPSWALRPQLARKTCLIRHLLLINA